MAYTATSIDVFIAAYSGAIGGYQRNHQVSRPSGASYTRIANAALAFAEAFDTLFAVVLPNELQLQEIKALAEENMVYPNNNTTALAAATYTDICQSMIDMMSDTAAVVAANVTNPIPVPTPVSTEVLQFSTVVGAGGIKTTVPVSAIAAIVDGHTSAGDQGGGLFFWDPTSAATDDAGTIINPTGHVGNGRWIRIYSGALNVRWFGAQNSVADNEAPFAAALAALGTPPQGALYIPKDPVGPYPFLTTLTMTGTGFEALCIYGDVAGLISDRGTVLRWDGANDASVVFMNGVTNVFWSRTVIDCNSKARYGWDIQGNDPTQGTSTVQFEECAVFSPKPNAGIAAGWAFGDAGGFQCDNLSWVSCVTQGATQLNCAGWFGRGGGNVKEVTWDRCKAINLNFGIHWELPSGRNSCRSMNYTSINNTCNLYNEGNLVIESPNTESCTGYFLRSTGGGAASGCVTVIGGQVIMTCNADDMVSKWQAGFQIYLGVYLQNLRTGATVPKLVVNSGYGYANNNNYGMIADGCTFINAATPGYAPIVDEGGTAILTAARLQGAAGPAPIWSKGCLGGPIGGALKLLPVNGREEDSPQFGQGLMYTSAAGVKSTADPIPLPATTTMQIGAVTKFLIQGNTQQLGDATAVTGTKFLNLLMANIAGCQGIFGTPFTQYKVTDAATIEIFANGNRVFRGDGTGIGLYANATVAQQQVTNNTGDAGAATQVVDVTTGGLADPAKINANIAVIVVKLQNLGALKN